MTRRSTTILATATAACVVLTVGTVLAVYKIRRDREWAHGGDTLAATAEVHVAAPADYPATVAAFGGPRTTTAVMDEAKQAVVVRVRWSGPAHDDGSYNLLVLDSRMKPAQLLPLRGSWSAGGRETYDGWEGAYDALAEHYAWLAGIAHGDSGHTQPDGSAYALRATGIPATAQGELDGVYFIDGGRPPFAGTGGVLVALFYEDDSGVRWAKRVTG
jgi:hypothetical protein